MGKRLFQQFFEDYTEKVWGISCQELSSDWAAQRIKGLDLAVAIKGALGMLTKRPVTLVDRFDYPRLGIGLLSDRMSAAVRQGNGKVECGAKVSGMESAQGRIGAIQLANGTFVEADDFVMTGPLTQVARWLSPDGIGWGADRLRWRGLITVFLELDMPRLSRSHWIYFPDREIPFGRLHEPKNWSRDMAPANRTGIVVEYFASPQDQRWLSSDDDLIRLTGDVLGELKFIQPGMVRGGRVDRFVHAYPTYTVGYQQWVNGIYRRLRGFGNLSLSGRTGLFRYHNIDHAIETGWETSKQILTGDGDPYRVNQARAYLEDANHVE
jgi:protoporphyrinogen oxidase